MPVFAYKGLASTGKTISGVQDADNLRALRTQLRRDGIYLTEAHEANLRAAAAASSATDLGLSAFKLLLTGRFAELRSSRKDANRQQVAIITRQLGVLLKAGVPLSESLGALVDQVDHPSIKRILADVKTQVNEGSSLADAMNRHPRSFEELYTNMVRAGETAGNLDSVLFRLAEFLDAQNRLKSKIVSAMVYPILMLVMTIVIMSILMTTVIPKMSLIFADMGTELPWNTALLVNMSHIVGSYWWLLILLGGAIFFGVRAWLRTEGGKAFYDRFLLRVWVIGPLVRMIAISRFAKTLATMLASGVPLLQALEIVKSILGNKVLTDVIEKARESIKEGESIAAPLKRSGQFPPIVTHMIAVGERTGQLEDMLENVASSYDVEVDIKIQRLTTLLEPLMILVMAGSVAFIVFSVLGPILKMNEFVT